MIPADSSYLWPPGNTPNLSGVITYLRNRLKVETDSQNIYLIQRAISYLDLVVDEAR